MQILSEDDLKSLDKNTPDVSIGIADEKNKDDPRKFKFKRPLMLKIFIPLCILTLLTATICLLSLSSNYELVLDKTLQDDQVLDLLSSRNAIREKRELEICEECEEELDDNEDLENAVYRCKKNIEENKDCCDLYKKVKKLNKVMEDVKKEFFLLKVPCGNKDDNATSSSSSSDEDNMKENKSGNKEENAAEEVKDDEENMINDEKEPESEKSIQWEKTDSTTMSDYELDGGNDEDNIKENKSGNIEENAAEEVKDNEENMIYDEKEPGSEKSIQWEKTDSTTMSDYELDGGNDDNVDVIFKFTEPDNSNQDINNTDQIPSESKTDYKYNYDNTDTEKDVDQTYIDQTYLKFQDSTTENIMPHYIINKFSNFYEDTDKEKDIFTDNKAYETNFVPMIYNDTQTIHKYKNEPDYSQQIDDYQPSNYKNSPIQNEPFINYATEPSIQDFTQNGEKYYNNEAELNNKEYSKNQNYNKHENLLEDNFVNNIPPTPKYVDHELFDTRTEYNNMYQQKPYDIPREDETNYNQHYDVKISVNNVENSEDSNNFENIGYNTEIYPKLYGQGVYSNIINNNFEGTLSTIEKNAPLPRKYQNSVTTQDYSFSDREEGSLEEQSNVEETMPHQIVYQNSVSTQDYNFADEEEQEIESVEADSNIDESIYSVKSKDYNFADREEPHQDSKQQDIESVETDSNIDENTYSVTTQYYNFADREEPHQNAEQQDIVESVEADSNIDENTTQDYNFANREEPDQNFKQQQEDEESVEADSNIDENIYSVTTQDYNIADREQDPTSQQNDNNDYKIQENENSEQNYDINVKIKEENSAEILTTITVKSATQKYDYDNINHETTAASKYQPNYNDNFKENHNNNDYNETNSYDKQYVTTGKSASQLNYKDNFEANQYDNHNNENFNHEDQPTTTTQFVNQNYNDHSQEHHYTSNYNENIDNNNKEQIQNKFNEYIEPVDNIKETSSTTLKYVSEEDYYPTSANKVVNDHEKTSEGIELLDQLKNMNANIKEHLVFDSESNKHEPEEQFNKEIITRPANLYEEEIQTKKLNNEYSIIEDYNKHPLENNNPGEHINVQVNINEENYNVSPTPTTATTETYKDETIRSEYYNNFPDSLLIPENKLYLTQSTTTEQNYKTTPALENKKTSVNNKENSQEENFKINVDIKLEDSNEKSIPDYIKTSSSVAPSLYDYEKDIQKINYYKDEHELKPEQLYNKTNISIDHVGNSPKYYRDIGDNEDSIDDYTDNQGNIEDIENSQENLNILNIRTSSTTHKNYLYTDLTKTENINDPKVENYYNTGLSIEKIHNDEQNIQNKIVSSTQASQKYNDTTSESHSLIPKLQDLNYLDSNEGNKNYHQKIKTSATEDEIETKAKLFYNNLKMALEENNESTEPTTTMKNINSEEIFVIKPTTSNIVEDENPNLMIFPGLGEVESVMPIKTAEELFADARIKNILQQNKTSHENNESDLLKLNYPTADPDFYLHPEQFLNTNTNINVNNPSGRSQPRIQDVNGNDLRIVNQNPIAQRFQNTGTSKFDNIFPLPPIETSKASQQLTVNTNMLPMCFYGHPNQNGQLLRQPGFDAQINPFSMGAYGYPQMFLNNLNQQPMYNYYNSMIAHQKYSQPNIVNQPPYTNNPYFCTYVPSSSLQFPPITGAQEFRNTENKNFPIPEDIDDKTIPKDWFPQLINSNKSRSSINCLPDEKSCFDGTNCIKKSQWCDGTVHCSDKSDELGCTCKSRVDKSRLCDGYFDCPNGEDELGCFGCNSEEFSCDDWSERHRTATCVSLHQRCDGVPQCRTRKDEMDCSLLTNSINVHQTYAVSKSSGYLHRNYKGNWYPVCSNDDTWILDACLAEVGPQATLPLVHMLPVPNDYAGEFLTAIPNKKVEFLKSCIGGEAVYIICPPIPCGTRLLPPPNHFRKQEVDTSAEEDFLPFVSRLRRFTDELHRPNHHSDILKSNDFADKKKHVTLDMHVNQHIDIHNDEEWSWEDQERKKRGDSRVVGGKPSQPTSWPWVVAIYRDGIFHCGGVLMSELWVITAAHCVDTYWQHYYEVQAGMLRRFSFSPMEQNRIVSNIIGHQMYDRTDMKNDLALLKVAQPFQFNRWVRPVCLPSESSAGPNWMWGPQPGTICTAVGWGATVEHGPDPDHMREVEVPILSHCKHREDQEGQEICAGYLEGGRDACQGDSGGPLLCRNPIAPSQWYVAGIVSHGEGCARPNEPGAYTRVSLYLNWIARSILDENLPKRRPIQKCPGILCLGTRRCISKKRHCDKTIDCLVGDDEINCPKSDYSSLIKHAFENMLLFAPNNMTTAQPEEGPILREGMKGTETNVPRMESNVSERKGVKINSGKIVTIAEEHTTENDSITRSAFKEDGGQTSTMNRNGDISSTFTAPLGEISDITRPITNPPLPAQAPTTGETPKASITPSTFITADDTISESTTLVELTTLNDVTVTTSIRGTETPASSIINDSRGALNTNDKNIVDMDHKTETTTSGKIKSISETSTAYNAGDDHLLPMINNSDDSKSIERQMPTYFECRKMLQLIPMTRRCDNNLDCEDGTDEAHCSCKGYLFASHPNAICDGIIDCADGSDERDCINCPNTHFHCHLSQQCVPKSLQCNYVPDCFFSEDEWDCFALTNSSYIRYDSDERPELRGKGIMSFSFSGKWFPLCNNNWFQSAHDVAGDMCAYLGFSGYQKYSETEVKQSSLEILSKDATSLSLRSLTNDTCNGLYVKCSNSLSDTGDMKKIYTAHQSGANTFKEALMSPWNAAIFVDGVYTCSGTLIEKNWVITSRTCLHHMHLHMNYTTVMLGTGRGHFNVIGPHEQIRLVSEIIPIIVTDVLLLKLQKPVIFTRYVRPLHIRNINNDIVSERETCLVLGKEHDSFMQVMLLRPVLEKCLRGKRCFKRITPLGNCDAATSVWGGTIVCLSETGWYPAAVYYDQKGICGFRTTTEYTSIRNLKARIITAMNKHDFPVTPPKCNGIRCPLGQCISSHRTCDGISDCRDGSDEYEELCYQKSKNCSVTNTCECAPTELRCHNGRCVPKSAFCDRVNDCGDWSDEPARCNCSSYLALEAPHRLCDGISNCHDKTDENPRICACREDSYKCGNTDVCISNDWVCDGDFDCPGKEDEMFCLALRGPEGGRDGVGEVVLRSYGVWHSYCVRDKPLTTPDLEEICTKLGFQATHVAAVNKTFTRPAQDIAIENFSLVRFNEHMMMFLRGNHPMAKLQNNEKCERLYIECTPP